MTVTKRILTPQEIVASIPNRYSLVSLSLAIAELGDLYWDEHLEAWTPVTLDDPRIGTRIAEPLVRRM